MNQKLKSFRSMSRFTVWAVFGLLLIVAIGARANGTPYYFDFNGTSTGFGLPSGTNNQNGTFWSTDPSGLCGGTNAVALQPGAQMTFGNSSSDLAGTTFTINMNVGGGYWAGLAVNSSSANITLNGTGNAFLNAPCTWTVAAGSILTEAVTFNNFGLNFNNQAVTLNGAGTINFGSSVGYNDSNTINQNMPSGTVNLNAAWNAGSASQANYTLTAGTLNFSTANALNGLTNVTTAGTLFSINGGTIDNTSGSAMTLGLGSATNSIGGSFTFNGSSSLNLNTNAVVLSATPTITVNKNTLTIGGVISGSSFGLTKAGAGTLTLNGSAVNTFAGGLNVNGGNVALIFTNLASPNNLINSANTLTLSGGALNVIGNSAATAQTFNGVTVNSGNSLVTVTPGSGVNATTLTLGTVAQGQIGGIVSFAALNGGVLAGPNTSTNIIKPANAVSSYIGSWASIAGNTTTAARWANINASGQLAALSGTAAGANMASVNSASTVYTITGNNTLGANCTAFAIQDNDASNGSVTFGGFTLTTGGISQISGNGSFTRTFSGATGGGGIVVGASELVMMGNNNLIVSVPIMNGTGGNTNVTYAGGGTLLINTVPSTYTGQTTVNSGTVRITSGGSINNSARIVVNGGNFIQDNATTAVTPAITLQGGTVGGTNIISMVNVTSLAANTIINGDGSTLPLTISNLTFNGSATVYVNLNSGGSAGINVPATLTTTPANGKVTINVTNNTVWVANTTNNLISFGGWSGSISDFQLGTLPGLNALQLTPSLITNGNNIALVISPASGGYTSAVWTGLKSGSWTIGTVGSPYNWALSPGGPGAEFSTSYPVLFDDTATGVTNVVISEPTVSPYSTTFNNTNLNYTISSLGSYGGIASGSVTLNGTGKVTISTTTNTYSGGTTVNGGILKLTGGAGSLGAPAPGTNAVTVNSGASLDVVALLTLTNPAVINGPGSTATQGALMNSTGVNNLGLNNDNINNVVLAGDATIGNNSSNGGQAYDAGFDSAIGIGKSGLGISGNNHVLTKIGSNGVYLYTTAVNSPSAVVIAGGGLLYYNTASQTPLGNAPITLTNNAIFSTLNTGGGAYVISNSFTVASNGGQIKNNHTWFGNVDTQKLFGSFTLNGPLTLTCSTFQSPSAYGATTISGNISGVGGITNIVATNTITLIPSVGANTYTGITTVQGPGTLLISSANQGGGDYVVADGSTLSLAYASGYPYLPASSLTLGASTGCTLSLSKWTAVPNAQAPISVTALTLNGTTTLQLTNMFYGLSGQYPLIKYTTASGSGTITLAVPSVRGVSAYISNNVANSSYDLVVNNGNTVTWTGSSSANWDIATTSNWQTNGVATTYQQSGYPGDAVLFNDTATQTNVNLSVGVSPLIITVSNASKNISFSGSAITNAATLVKAGTGTLTVSNAANSFTGGTYISGGTVALGNSNALNNVSGSQVTVSAGGTFDLAGLNPNNTTVNLSGSGVGGNGALVSTYVGPQTTFGPSIINLTGSATIGDNASPTNRWDLKSGANQLNCPTNAYSLTKVGPGMTALVGTTVSTNLGDINILGGTLGYQTGTTGLGNPANTLRIGTNATLEFFQSSVPLNKNIICSNGASFLSESGGGYLQNIIAGPVSVVAGATVKFNANSGSLNFSSPISIPSGTLSTSGGTPNYGGGLTSLNGQVTLFGTSLVGGPVNIPSGSTLFIQSSFYNTVTFSNVISGSGTYNQQYQTFVYMAASNTFSGNITLPYCGFGPGTSINLVGEGSITKVPTITLQGITTSQPYGAFLVVSNRTDGTLTLSSNQTLSVDNGTKVFGHLTVGSGANLSMSSYNYFTNVDRFTVSGNLTFQSGSTNVMWINGSSTAPTNTSIQVNGVLTYGGTLFIKTNGVTMQAGSSFVLFPTAGSYAGAFSSISPAAPGPNLAWDTTQLLTSGTLKVVATASANAYLASLVVSNNAGDLLLDPGFTTNNTGVYFATNVFGSPVTVTVTNGDPAATDTLFLNGISQGTIASGVPSAPMTLGVGSNNVVSVQVVSPDLSVTKTYLVAVFQSPSMSSPSLTNSVGSTSMTLSWPADHLGWFVESNSVDLSNSSYWFEVPGTRTSTSYTVDYDVTQTNVFYRLTSP